MGRSPTVCCTPGCPELSPKSHCSAHTKPSPSGVNGYGGGWKARRAEHLRYSPLCLVCGAKATVVDHAQARSRGGSEAWSNLISLCKRCHDRVTSTYDGGFGNPLDPEGKALFYRAHGIVVET